MGNPREAGTAPEPAAPARLPDIGTVRSKVLDSLETLPFLPDNPLLDRGFVYCMVVQHEHQHDETMLATHQLRRGAAVLGDVPPDPAPADAGLLPAEVLVPGGPFVMGTSDDGWAYDNERPAHVVHLDPYAIDAAPVTNEDFALFIADGGYANEHVWSTDGWAWRCEAGLEHPQFWQREPGAWTRDRFGFVERLVESRPAQRLTG